LVEPERAGGEPRQRRAYDRRRIVRLPRAHGLPHGQDDRTTRRQHLTRPTYRRDRILGSIEAEENRPRARGSDVHERILAHPLHYDSKRPTALGVGWCPGVAL